jgi:TolB-like protein
MSIRARVARLVFWSLVGTTTPALALDTEGRSAAVLDFTARQGASADLAATVSDGFASSLRQSGRLGRVVSMADVRTTINFDVNKQMVDCASGSCMAEMGAALGVDYLVSGNVGKVGRVWVVNITMVQSGSGMAVGTVQRFIESNDAADVVLVTPSLVGELLGDAPGALVVRPVDGSPANSAAVLKPAGKKQVEDDPSLSFSPVFPALLGLVPLAGVVTLGGGALVALVLLGGYAILNPSSVDDPLALAGTGAALALGSAGCAPACLVPLAHVATVVHSLAWYRGRYRFLEKGCVGGTSLLLLTTAAAGAGLVVLSGVTLVAGLVVGLFSLDEGLGRAEVNRYDNIGSGFTVMGLGALPLGLTLVVLGLGGVLAGGLALASGVLLPE